MEASVKKVEGNPMKLEKHFVCIECFSVGIKYTECVCTYVPGFKKVQLEFEICECCGNLKGGRITSGNRV